MTTFRPLQRGPSAAAALLSLFATGCASTPPMSADYVPPSPGSTVQYRMTSTGSFGEGTSLSTMRISEATWQGRRVMRYDGPAGAVLNDERAGVVASLDPAGRPVAQYDPPPPPGYRWPISVGKTWVSDHVLTTASGNKVPMKASWKVEAYEDVTVPAGTFKAWRVSMVDGFGFRQTTWSVPESLGMFARRLSERPAEHPQKAGTQLYEMTQVPAIR